MRPTRNALIAALNEPSRRLLAAAEAAAQEVNADLWLAGGGVRDLATGRRLHDLDLAFAGQPREFVDGIARRLPAAAVERTDRFGTASVTLEGARMDVARLRTEHYVVPGALPTVRATSSIEADLARRDFTVNAFALTLAGPGAGGIVDPFDGLGDLRARRLRVLHDRSFIDDATRLWRGARTAALFGLVPDATTDRLIAEGTRWLDEISGERLWHEFATTATRGRALQTCLRLDEWGVLAATHRGFALSPASAAALAGRRAMPSDRLAAVLLAPLHARVRTGVLDRLAVRREVRTTVADCARLLEAGDAPDSPPGILETLEGAHPEARIASLWLDPQRQPGLQRALRRWERTRPHLDAAHLVKLGVRRGPALGIALRGLRRARYLGTLRSATEARALTRAVLAGDAIWDAD